MRAEHLHRPWLVVVAVVHTARGLGRCSRAADAGRNVAERHVGKRPVVGARPPVRQGRSVARSWRGSRACVALPVEVSASRSKDVAPWSTSERSQSRARAAGPGQRGMTSGRRRSSRTLRTMFVWTCGTSNSVAATQEVSSAGSRRTTVRPPVLERGTHGRQGGIPVQPAEDVGDDEVVSFPHRQRRDPAEHLTERGGVGIRQRLVKEHACSAVPANESGAATRTSCPALTQARANGSSPARSRWHRLS